MSNVSKNMVVGSMIASGLVALAAFVDLAFGFPFARNIMMDVLFLVAAGMVGYMAYDAYQDLV